MTINNNTPGIRFSRFSEDWIRGEVRDVLKIKSGMSQRDIEVTGGIYPILATGGEIGRTNTPLYNKESVLIGRKGTIDKPYYMNSPFWTVDTLFYSELAEDASGLFIFTLFQKIQWRKLNTSTGVPSLTSSTIHSIPISFPKKSEQIAIGEYFQHIDKTITIYRSKHEKTKFLKNTFLSRMFPQAEEDQPKIRLKNFNEEWTDKKLGDIGYTYTGLSGKTKHDFGHGSAKYVTYMNVYSNTLTSVTMLDNVEVDSRQNLVEKGDVLFTTSSETPEEVGMSSVWQHNYYPIYLNSFCFGFRLTQEVDLNYIAFMLRSDKVRSKIILLAQGISRFNISKKAMMEIEVPLPTMKEQIAIGQFFKQLDDTLALQAKQLKALENLKKALLAKMFV